MEHDRSRGPDPLHFESRLLVPARLGTEPFENAQEIGHALAQQRPVQVQRDVGFFPISAEGRAPLVLTCRLGGRVTQAPEIDEHDGLVRASELIDAFAGASSRFQSAPTLTSVGLP